MNRLLQFYQTCLAYPGTLLVGVLLVILAALPGLRDFGFDASADTLVVEGDPGLAKYNRMSALFGGDDFVVLTYSTNDVASADSVVSRKALSEIASLQEQLELLEGTVRTFSILDVPLIKSPPIPLDRLAEGYQTLRNPDVDLALARLELTSSPLVSNYLIAEDGSTTAIMATLGRNADLDRDDYVAARDALIKNLREIRDNYQGDARLFISGVPMIAADMLSYVRSDLSTFGGLVLLLIIALLAFFFRKPRWVVIPLLVCLVTVILTMSLLGYLGTPVTVVSSNFISLLSIISISFSIHLVVRFRELLEDDEMAHPDMVLETMRSKFTPCLYTALTTLLAFGSMLASRIEPIIDFGWMMCLGIVISLLVTYVLFPAILLKLGDTSPSKTLGQEVGVARLLQYLATEKSPWVIAVAGLLILPGVYGVSQLSFDNRFTDYFAQDTDIYQGMSQIDRHLGGTLPLDVYIRFEQFDPAGADEDDFFSEVEDVYPERYWFTPDKIEVLRRVQAKLEARPEIGKVISLASMEEMARQFNDGNALGGVEIAYVLGELPPDIRSFMIDPYAHPETGWMRVNARVTESLVEFSKDALVSDMRRFAIEELNFDPEDVVVTGMIVLFNDMLKQLADSQANTLLYVVAATFIMFSLLLRSPLLALIALIPNVLAALLIVAIMGIAGISLDMMTVTIAAICIGIGVDDAIHYLHRYREELDEIDNAKQAVAEAHQTIGHAMYYTTATIMAGFSILAFSNFIPTIYFGLLTAVAMALALLANMTLLPSLLIFFSRR